LAKPPALKHIPLIRTIRLNKTKSVILNDGREDMLSSGVINRLQTTSTEFNPLISTDHYTAIHQYSNWSTGR